MLNNHSSNYFGNSTILTGSVSIPYYASEVSTMYDQQKTLFSTQQVQCNIIQLPLNKKIESFCNVQSVCSCTMILKYKGFCLYFLLTNEFNY